MMTHEIVAAEVRAQMARQRVTSRSIARRMGWSGTYLSRRLTGSVAFNVTDLAAIAGLLDLPVSAFLESPAGLGGGVRTLLT